MAWSPQQDEALRKIRQWLAQPNGQQVFRLFGYAGTGKTTLAKEIAGCVSGIVVFGAFTGKAALVLRNKGCPASTLHSLLYKPDKGADGKVIFTLNRDSIVGMAKLIIVDEVSMVDDALAEDLLYFRRPILVLGDPAQLPPIRGTGYFIHGNPDVLLTEIHRQASDNPIIHLSMLIRERGVLPPLGHYGQSRIMRRAECMRSDVKESNQIICGKNLTRQRHNSEYRKLCGIEAPGPMAGERLICLRNQHDRGLLNGGMWEVTRQAEDLGESYFLRVRALDDPTLPEPLDVLVRKEFFNYTEDQIPHWERRESDEFTYGYAITCHKAQGSEWPYPIVFDESSVFRDTAARWLYTAVTRASERITIVI